MTTLFYSILWVDIGLIIGSAACLVVECAAVPMDQRPSRWFDVGLILLLVAIGLALVLAGLGLAGAVGRTSS